MFHKAASLSFKEGTRLEVSFTDGAVKSYDMARLFDKYPCLRALENRKLFLSGKLLGSSGVYWTDELDIDAESIYEFGDTVAQRNVSPEQLSLSEALRTARAKAGMTQQQLAENTGIRQSDISKIERCAANPSLSTLSRLANGLHAKLTVSFE